MTTKPTRKSNLLIPDTSFTVKRPMPVADAYDRGRTSPTQVVSTGLRGHLGSGSQSRSWSSQGAQDTTSARIITDLADIRPGDLLVNESTNVTYEVTGSFSNATGLLPHTTSQVQIVTRGNE